MVMVFTAAHNPPIVYYMFVVCSLQAHSMFTVCLLHVRCMLTGHTVLKLLIADS